MYCKNIHDFRSVQNKDLLILASIILFLTAITNILAAAFMAKNIADNAQYFAKGAPLFWWGVVYRYLVIYLVVLDHQHLHQDHLEWTGHLHHVDRGSKSDQPHHSPHIPRQCV